MKVLMLVATFLVFAVSAQAKTVEIKMLNMGKDGPMAFEPAFVKVSPGDSVKFIPTDLAHNSKAVFGPDGAKLWEGKMDEAIEVKLDKEGVYIYACDPHIPMAMVGVIQVGNANNLDAAKKFSETYSARMVMNKDRLTKYLGQAK